MMLDVHVSSIVAIEYVRLFTLHTTSLNTLNTSYYAALSKLYLR